MADAQETATHDAAPAERKRRRWPWVLVGIVAALLLLVALTPTIASLRPVRGLIIDKVNEQLAGELAVDSWSLGWLSGVQVEGVTLKDAAGRPAIQIERVVLPASVPALLGSTKRLGVIEIVGPKIDVVLEPDGSINLAKLTKPAPEAPPEPAPATDQGPQPLGLDVSGTLRVRDGSVTIREAAGGEPVVLHGLSVDVKIDSLSQAIPLSIKALLGKECARLDIDGSATVTRDGVPDPEALKADLAVKLDPYDLAPVAALARRFGVPVDFGGRLSLDVSAEIEGTTKAKTSGTIALAEVSATGGPLGGDEPTLDTTTLAYNLALDDGQVTITRLRLDTPFVAALVTGKLVLPEDDGLPTGTLWAHTRVDVAAIAAQLPHTVPLPEGWSLKSGVVTVFSALALDGEGQKADTTVIVDPLAGRYGERDIRLEAPLILAVKGMHSKGEPKVDSFSFTSSFATLTGKGDLDTLELKLVSDLAAATRQVAQLVDLGGKALDGTATLTVNVGGPDRQHRKADIALDLAKVKATGLGPKPLALEAVRLTLAALAELDKQNALQQVRDVAVTLNVPFADAKVTAAMLKPLEDGDVPVTLSGGSVTLNADLAKALAVARSLAELPADIGVAGKLDLTCGLALANGTAQANGLDLTLAGLDFAQGEKHFRQPSLRLRASARAKPATSEAHLRDLVCTLSFGTVGVSRLDATAKGVSADAKVDLDIGKALVAAKDFATLPEGTAIRGKLTLSGTAATDDTRQTASVKLGLTRLDVVTDGKTALEDETVTLNTAAAYAAKPGTLDVDTLELLSRPLKLRGKIALRELNASPGIKSSGTLDIDFARVAPLVETFSGEKIEMAGSGPRPFSVDTSLAGKEWHDIVRATLASAGIRIERLKYAGIEASDVSIPVASDRNKATVTIEAVLNSGKLSLPVTLDVSGKTPILTVPKGTVVLADAALSDWLADQLLGRISPLFKGAPIAGGQIGILVKELRLPLNDDPLDTAVIDVELQLHAIALRNLPFLEPILNLAKIKADGFQLPDQRIGVAIKDRRIHHSPMSIGVGNYRLELGGSVGFDGSLELVLGLPITPGLIGGNTKLFGFLKDERLKIPIRGPALKPDFSLGAIRKAVADLVKRAAAQMLKIGDPLKKDIKGVGSAVGGKKGEDDKKDDEKTKEGEGEDEKEEDEKKDSEKPGQSPKP